MMFEVFSALILYINKKYEINTTISDYHPQSAPLDVIIKRFRPEMVLSINDVHRDIGKNFLYSIEWYKEIKPAYKMCTTIKKLSNHFDIFALTNMHSKGKNVVEYLLDKYIPGCVSDIHFIWSHSEKGDFIEVSKKTFIEYAPGYNIAFFGVLPGEITEIQEIILPSFLFEANGMYHKNPGIAKVGSWEEIGDIFL